MVLDLSQPTVCILRGKQIESTQNRMITFAHDFFQTPPLQLKNIKVQGE